MDDRWLELSGSSDGLNRLGAGDAKSSSECFVDVVTLVAMSANSEESKKSERVL